MTAEIGDNNDLTVDEKRKRLMALAQVRKLAQWEGYKNIGDYHEGFYDRDHDHVSPVTKGADNLNSKIMIMLQDWDSDEGMKAPIDMSHPHHVLGYDPKAPTHTNLAKRLDKHFGIQIKDTYSTNIFPFIKPGKQDTAIPASDLLRAAQEYGIPQIDIIQPVLVIVLGHVSYWAMAKALGQEPKHSLVEAVHSPIDTGRYRVYCQAHTALDAANLGGLEKVDAAWAPMAEWYKTAMQH